MFLRRLAQAAAAPIANPHAYRGQSASTSPLSLAAIASISAGLSSFYYFNSPNLVTHFPLLYFSTFSIRFELSTSRKRTNNGKYRYAAA